MSVCTKMVSLEACKCSFSPFFQLLDTVESAKNTDAISDGVEMTSIGDCTSLFIIA